MTSPLENLVETGSLQRQSFDADEYQGLVSSGRARLGDAENPQLAIESRFDLAHNAAHALSLAALRKAGYRSTNRHIVFQVLPHTAGLGPEVWRVLAKAHQVRNDAEYEGHIELEESLVAGLIRAAKAVEAALA